MPSGRPKSVKTSDVIASLMPKDVGRTVVGVGTIKTHLQLFKRWRINHGTGIDDGRVRPAHLVADGQEVPEGEPFIVDGELLMFPGDPKGSPENVINCRCGMEHFYKEVPLEPDARVAKIEDILDVLEELLLD